MSSTQNVTSHSGVPRSSRLRCPSERSHGRQRKHERPFVSRTSVRSASSVQWRRGRAGTAVGARRRARRGAALGDGVRRRTSPPSGTKVRPPLPFPAGLRPLLRQKRLTRRRSARARRAVEDDAGVPRPPRRRRHADLVDEIGLVWLRRPPGWQRAARRLVVGTAAADATSVVSTRAAPACRGAGGCRARAWPSTPSPASAGVREHEPACRAAGAPRRGRARAGRRDRLGVAGAGRRRPAAGRAGHGTGRRHGRPADEATAALERAADAEAARDAVLAARAGEPLVLRCRRSVPGRPRGRSAGRTTPRWRRSAGRRTAARRDRRRRIAAAAQRAGAGRGRRRAAGARRRGERSPADAGADPRRAVRQTRRPWPSTCSRLPGIVVLVDGYNVAKLGWPALALEVQRERTDRRRPRTSPGAGARTSPSSSTAPTCPGRAPPARRLVRVMFSPAGVPADDVLRAEVAALDHRRAVVVVTSDQAVVADVRADGRQHAGQRPVPRASARR